MKTKKIKNKKNNKNKIKKNKIKKKTESYKNTGEIYVITLLALFCILFIILIYLKNFCLKS